MNQTLSPEHLIFAMTLYRVLQSITVTMITIMMMIMMTTARQCAASRDDISASTTAQHATCDVMMSTRASLAARTQVVAYKSNVQQQYYMYSIYTQSHSRRWPVNSKRT